MAAALRIPGHRYKATGNAFSEVILDLKDISQLQNDAKELPCCSRRNSLSTEKKATVSENVVIVEDLKTPRLSESVITKQKSSRPSITAPEEGSVVALEAINGSQNLDDADTVVSDDETVMEDKESAQKGASLHTRDLSRANYHQPASERTRCSLLQLGWIGHLRAISVNEEEPETFFERIIG
ncbi:hypothetical protein CEK26_007557 [Fusarium fujikuroi]|nr:Uncharacterized protein Y057_2988 [Fusarium fujikuroi]QGI63606.1 hypothetical protein CEK27_007577 [Fusarium fujikuroi]QGI80877.1 hypothetical protein CEK25_007606 [Fusarium fujikuroi]QGI94488.1 hypothetical protein CEK26_007557 [Fusarium fujikuroi]